MLIYDATFNFQFVSCKQPIIKCRIQHSIFWRLKNWLLNATFNFSVDVFEDLIIDDNIQFSIFSCKTMGCQLQHSILYSYNVYTGLFRLNFVASCHKFE